MKAKMQDGRRVANDDGRVDLENGRHTKNQILEEKPRSRLWSRQMIVTIVALNLIVLGGMMNEMMRADRIDLKASRLFHQMDALNASAHAVSESSEPLAESSSERANPAVPSRTTSASKSPTTSESTPEPTTSKPPKKCEKMIESHLEARYVPPNVCLSREEIQQIIINLVHVAADQFTKHNITYWLDSGTLLGSFREHTVIPHDEDADFGMDEASFRKLQTTTVINMPAPYLLSVLDSSIYNGKGRDENIPVRVIDTSNGFYIDVFVFLESVNSEDEAMIGPVASVCFWSCVRCRRTANGPHFLIPKDWVFPLQSCGFADKQVRCPQEPAKYLDFLYGSNYMKPDKLRRSRR